MVLKRLSKLGILITCVGIVGASVTGASNVEHSIISPEQFYEEVQQYQQSNPGDFIGLRNLVEGYGGIFSVSTSVTGPTTAENASAAFTAMDGQQEGALDIAPMAIPTNAFVVGIASSRHPASTIANVWGSWNWRDDFVGQTDPVDIAALSFSQSCGLYSGHTSSTYTWDSISTNKGTLRSAGLGAAGPSWNIDAYTSGFKNTADHGGVGVNVDLASCTGTVQGAFAYEGNQGGSVISVSVSWLGLSVSYSGSSATLQKSSGVTNL